MCTRFYCNYIWKKKKFDVLEKWGWGKKETSHDVTSSQNRSTRAFQQNCKAASIVIGNIFDCC